MPSLKIDKKILDNVNSTVTSLFYNDGMLDLDALCKHLGIGLYEAEFNSDKTSGALIHLQDKEWNIYVNKSHALVRKRFTIAHELGHWFVFQYGDKRAPSSFSKEGIITDVAYRRKGKLSDVQYELEKEANSIAARILMPEKSVDQLWGDKTPEQMSQIFGVSEAAMAFRLKELGYQTLEAI